MPKYLLKVRYSGEGLAGVLEEGGSARRAVADAAAKEVGGSIESMYFAFGDEDAFLICDFPDNAAAAQLAMTVSSSGRVSITTVPLLTVDDVDEATSRKRIEYTAPGT